MKPESNVRLDSINDKLYGEISMEEQQFLVGGATWQPTDTTTTHNGVPDKGWDYVTVD